LRYKTTAPFIAEALLAIRHTSIAA
jgi:hypothetical protein